MLLNHLHFRIGDFSVHNSPRGRVLQLTSTILENTSIDSFLHDDKSKPGTRKCTKVNEKEKNTPLNLFLPSSLF